MKGGSRPNAGRKPLPPEEKTKPRSVRLNDELAAKLQRLHKAGRLVRWIKRAKE